MIKYPRLDNFELKHREERRGKGLCILGLGTVGCGFGDDFQTNDIKQGSFYDTLK